MIRLCTLLAIAGFVLPYAALVTWLFNSASMSLAWAQIIQNELAIMAWLDVVITAIALITFIRVDGRRNQIKQTTAPILATCLVGPSFGLPLYLLIRERSRTA